ncbi:MAG TPA: glycosyltransferase [Candidatus Butyricicoccus avistercoris]|uniref:Glycosyltransferase n=1 Tax=Candidatus Butyricicoccus avistercoris TaxID=2838518 RepID=A0A9D1THU6_9FIRM|nr:glycosyltransferase [Candidatus Butyricicoccus avistercoris]
MSNKKNKKKNNTKNNKKIELSIGLIVKNEERCLEKCLQALQPLRDTIKCEIVIADTGSTDRTKEIASKYADILFDFEWIDDFSAARNAVMSRCSGRWYLTVDADEYMDESSVDEMVWFLKSELSKEIQCSYIMINNYTNKNDLSQYNSFYALRMARLDGHIKYIGKIHESIMHDSLKDLYALPSVVFWHDGYLNIDNNIKKRKSKRNMHLIEEEISKNPNNILRYIQAIESSTLPHEKYEYVKQAIDLVEKKVNGHELFGKVVYRHAVNIAYEYSYPELSSWANVCLERYGNSLYTRVDVNYVLTKLSIRKRDYENVIKYGNDYISAIPSINDIKALADISLSILYRSQKKDQESVLLDMAEAYAKVGEYNKSKQILSEHSFGDVSLSATDRWLDILWILWDRIDISDIFNNVLNYIDLDNKDCIDKNTTEKKEILNNNIQKQFIDEDFVIEEEKKLPYPFIAKFDRCEFSYPAKIMLCDDINEMKELTNNIDKWDNIPAIVLYKLFKFKIRFPEKFYQMSNDDLNAASVKIVNTSKDLVENTVLDYLKENIGTENKSIKHMIFNYYLSLGQILVTDWEDIDDDSYYDEISHIYKEYSVDFLKLYYNENLLCEDMIDILPSMHGFAWTLIKYYEAFNNNQLKQAIYWLKKSLKLAPNIKELIKYLTDNVTKKLQDDNEQEQVNPELLALAEKVKIILNSYPQDDPSVLAIKQSDIYKKVAYLIEK